MRRQQAVGAVPAVVLATLLVARGCGGAGGGPGGPSPADAGYGHREGAISDYDAGSLDAADTGQGDDASGDAPPLACPVDTQAAGLPGGWIRWDGYNTKCGFCIPPSRDKFPAPIRWRACDPSVQPAGAVCSQMVVDWAPSPLGDAFSPAIAAYVDVSGTLWLTIGRFIGNTNLRLIGKADGDLAQAILEPNWRVCTLGTSWLNENAYAYWLAEDNADTLSGLLAGHLTDPLPTALLHFSDGIPHDYTVGTPGPLDTTTMSLYQFGTGSLLTRIGDPNDGALSYYEQTFVGDALLWEASSPLLSRLKVWTSAGGARDLVSFGEDTSQGAGDFGSDGHDLVWLYGSGRAAGVNSYPSMSIMTSPFTTDSTKVAPRRLRSELSRGFTSSAFVVGCGYAARANGTGFRLVRLADGVSWYLSADSTLAWQWERPIALTCTELFAFVHEPVDGAPPKTALARVRLDSLGPGTPPD